MEKRNGQLPEQKLEVIDLADPELLVAARPRPTRGRPPGSTSRARILADLELDNAEPASNRATPHRINGRTTRGSRADRGTPAGVKPDKAIFTLSVAAEILALHPRTLRIYEEHGLVVPHRTQTQRRRYSQNDIKKFQFIQFLTQRRRVNLEGVKIILTMLDELSRLGVNDPVSSTFPEYHVAD